VKVYIEETASSCHSYKDL